MKELYELQEKACEFIKMLNEKGKMGAADWEIADHVTATMKNIDKIMMHKQGGGYSQDGYSQRGYSRDGYSQDGHWRAEGQYGHGSSYGGYSGEHYVRGHYSRDGQSMSGYSQNGGRVMDQLQDMMSKANEKEKEVLRRCISELKSF